MPAMLNSNLDDLCSVIGYTATRKIAAWFCGRNLYVPVRTADDHSLLRLLGDSAFRALVSNFGGTHVWVPSAAEDRRYFLERVMAEQIGQGLNDLELADLHSMTVKRVQQLRVELTASGWVEHAQSIPALKPLAGRQNSGLEKRFARNFLEPADVSKIDPSESGEILAPRPV